MTRKHAKQIVMALDDKTRETIAVMVEETRVCYHKCNFSGPDAYETIRQLAAEIREKDQW